MSTSPARRGLRQGPRATLRRTLPGVVVVGTLAVLATSVVSATPTTAPTAAPTASEVDAPPDAGRLAASPVLQARPNAGRTFVGPNMSWGAGADNDSPACHATLPICVHWTNAADHAPPPEDGDGDHIPNQVERTLAAVATSWRVIVQDLGFKRPLSDLRSTVNGGDGRFDVYLADTGSRKLAGYTSSDDPRLAEGSTYRYHDVSAFLVLDNDYRTGQFVRGTAEENLQAAAAHEFFHAVEFAYDVADDPWLVEGTAAWAEDVVFDKVDLNRIYLQHSGLSAPTTPLDFGRQGHQYGSWIFFRYLSERFGRGIVARIWKNADDSPDEVSKDRLDTYSLRAVRRVLARQGRDFTAVFADFARVNLRPARFYSEGAGYPVPFSPNLALNQRGDDTGWLGTPLDHLAAFYVTFVPGENAPPNRRLWVRIDGPPRGFAPAARVVVRFDTGKARSFVVHLGKQGNGDVRVPFGRSSVTGVDVALINASTRYDACFKRSTSYSCRGVPKDDDRLYNVRARVL